MRFTKEVNIYAKGGTSKRFQALETDFGIVKGKISSLISESELKELQNGTKTMYSRLASAEQTVNGLTQKYTEVSSKYDIINSSYTELDSRVSEYKSTVDKFSADLTQLSSHIEKDYSTTQTMEAYIDLTINGLKTEISNSYVTQDTLNNYSTTEQMSTAIEASSTKISAEVRNVSYYNYCTNGSFEKDASGWIGISPAGGALADKNISVHREKNCIYIGGVGLSAIRSATWNFELEGEMPIEIVVKLALESKQAQEKNQVELRIDGTAIKTVPRMDLSVKWTEIKLEATTLAKGSHSFQIYPSTNSTYDGIYVTDVGIYAYRSDQTAAKFSVLSDSISSEIKRASDAEDALSSKVEQTATSIDSKVSKGSIISEINQTAEKVTISAAKINFNGLVTANNRFKINTDGSFSAAYGTLGGWAIRDGTIKSNDGKVLMDPKNNKICFGNNSSKYTTQLSPSGIITDYLTVQGGTAGGAMIIDAGAASEIKFFTQISSGGSTQTDRIHLQGNLRVYGTKSRVAGTENFSNRLLYCYETPTPMFGDLGCGETNERGIAIIDIDPVFLETVNCGIEYQVFLQKEGDGSLWIEEKEESYFIVKGTPNLKFSWELKCIQRNFEQMRLDEEDLLDAVSEDSVAMQKDYDIIIEELVNDYDKEMENLINEGN